MDFINVSTELFQTITAEQAWHYHIIPCSSEKGMVFYISKNHYIEGLEDELEMLFGKKITLKFIDKSMVTNTLEKYYHKSEKGSIDHSTTLEYKADDDFLNKLVEQAQIVGSSDIHIESYENKSRIRLRIDGKLVERYVVSKEDYPALINKIKIRSNLDIAEKRLPQDGRMSFENKFSKYDIRVSILPSLYGEKVVLRLLSRNSANIDLKSLGFTSKQYDDYINGINRLSGIVLISGPTGSGKTTTLYATLKVLNKVENNILTIEDPIEYTLEGINQVQLKESIGLNFANALRTFLRQDPDIIMLGEIRDTETAQMAIRAALTGHLVLSTIHTNSAWGTISRLLDMDIPGFLIGDTLNLSVAQRLVRMLCPNCRTKRLIHENELVSFIRVPENIQWDYNSTGCEKCFHTGYKGRKAIYEVIPIGGEIKNKIKSGRISFGKEVSSRYESMKDAAWELIRNGHTSFKEIYPILLNSQNN